MLLKKYWRAYWIALWTMSRISRACLAIGEGIVTLLIGRVNESLGVAALGAFGLFILAPINIVTFSSNPYKDDNKNDKIS